MDSFKKDAESFVRYITSSAKVVEKLFKPGLASIEKTREKAMELLKDSSPETVKNFYEFLIKTLETGFFEFFRSEDFNEALKTNFEVFNDFRTRHFEVLGSLLHVTPQAEPVGGVKADTLPKTAEKPCNIPQPNKTGK